MAVVLAERALRFTGQTGHGNYRMPPIYDVHGPALRIAGFREVGEIWQHVDNRVLPRVR